MSRDSAARTLIAMSSPKQMKLWELVAAEDNRGFSPYVWKIKLVLDAKVRQCSKTTVQRERDRELSWRHHCANVTIMQALEYKSVPWRYYQKDLIKPSTTVGVGEYSS